MPNPTDATQDVKTAILIRDRVTRLLYRRGPVMHMSRSTVKMYIMNRISYTPIHLHTYKIEWTTVPSPFYQSRNRWIIHSTASTTLSEDSMMFCVFFFSYKCMERSPIACAKRATVEMNESTQLITNIIISRLPIKLRKSRTKHAYESTPSPEPKCRSVLVHPCSSYDLRSKLLVWSQFPTRF